MILKVKDENGQFKEVVLKGLKGDKGDKGDRGEDGTVLQQKEIDDIKSSLDNIENEVGFLKENKLGFIAHRGSHILAPENTIKAIHLAGEFGYDFVELDVQYTSDNIPVLMHDDTIDRTTDGTGKISDYTYDEILNFVVDENYVGKNEDEIIRIPNFDDCIKECKKYNLGINVDCSKITWTEERINDIVNRLKNYGIFNRCFFVLSNEAQRDLMVKLYPNACVTWLTTTETVDENISKYKKYNNAFITCSVNTVTEDQLKKYKENNIPIFLYQCDTLEKCYKYSSYGVRFVETDVFLPKGGF